MPTLLLMLVQSTISSALGNMAVAKAYKANPNAGKNKKSRDKARAALGLSEPARK